MIKIRPARGGRGHEVDIRFTWPDGSLYRERRNAPVSGKAAALRWAEARERAILQAGPAALAPSPAPASEIPIFDTFWARFVLDHYKANRKKPSTIDAAETIFRRHLSPAIGTRRLDEITNADVARLKGRLADASPKTANNVLSVLSKALHCAVDWSVIPSMPCRVRLLKTADPSMRWYEIAEYRRLVEAARFSRRVLLLILLGGSAGLRRGEIIALRWTDVDLDRRQLRVARAIWRGQEGTPKGGRGRIVPLTPELASVLEAHKHIGDRVLYSERGEILSNRTIRNWLSRAQRRARLEDTGGIHILRHTFCSHLAAAGVPAKAIQELAGHADLKTTLRYMHLAPGDRDGAMALLARYHAGEGTGTGLRAVRKERASR